MQETLTLVEKTLFLKNVEVLSSMPTEALAQLASRSQELHLDPGDVVLREGEPIRSVFVVVEGAVEVRKDPTLLRVVGEGMVFGQLALTESEQPDVTATAKTHAHLLRITREDVFDAVLDHPEVGLALVGTLARVVQDLVRQVAGLEGDVARLKSRLEGAESSPERLSAHRATYDGEPD
jgi:CRP-like cAMP-binding protein